MPISDREARILAQLKTDLAADPDLAFLRDPSDHLPATRSTTSAPGLSRFVAIARWLAAPRPAPAALGLTLALEIAATIGCDLTARADNIPLLLATLCLVPAGLLPLAAHTRQHRPDDNTRHGSTS